LPAGSIKRKSFVYDPSVPKHIQIDNDEGYSNNRWDRGHLARRRALHWGDEATAVLADRQSSYWTNIAPQHENLHDTAWGSIEDWLFELADQGQRRLSVFVGPILMQHDPKLINKPGEREVQIPAGFWKVVALLHKGTLRAAAFVTWQRDHDSATPVSFDPVLEQVRLTTVEYLTSLSFMDLTTADPLRYGATETEGEDFEAETVEASGHASVLGSRSSVTSASSRERNGAVIRSAHDIAL
jgi:endonuclease G